MKLRKKFGNSRVGLIVFVITLLLLAAMLVHAIHFDHHHPEEESGKSEASTALHGENKKWWLLVVLAAIVSVFLNARQPVFFCCQTGILNKNFLYAATGLIDPQKLFNPLMILFKKGVLHPKLCS